MKAFVKQEFDMKARFYRAVQAVDLYMKVFTDAIARDPDAVRDIKQILDGTQVIARWFSEETGDRLWQAFERCRHSLPAELRSVAAPANPPTATSAGAHYYDKVRGGTPDMPARANLIEVGIPQAGVAPESDALKNATSNISAVFDNFQALKNLVNAFARIGDKFGGRDLHTKSSCPPPRSSRC